MKWANRGNFNNNEIYYLSGKDETILLIFLTEQTQLALIRGFCYKFYFNDSFSNPDLIHQVIRPIIGNKIKLGHSHI